MRKRFELVEHTADIALRVYEETLEQLFIHAAEGLFEILGTAEIQKRVSRNRSSFRGTAWRIYSAIG